MGWRHQLRAVVARGRLACESDVHGSHAGDMPRAGDVLVELSVARAGDERLAAAESLPYVIAIPSARPGVGLVGSRAAGHSSAGREKDR